MRWNDTPTFQSAREISRRVHERQTSARRIVEQTLLAIAAIDSEIAAFCTLSDTALAEADAIDRRVAAGEPVGPLAGVPLAVKDLIPTKGLRSTYGSPLYADNIPAEDEIVVARLKAAGAIVIGKTNTAEFGYGATGHNPLFPTTRNPWNTALTPGGSSAGSAAAVAAGMVPAALGSDGGGSVRIPAALTGTFGMKPSFGRVPLWPGCRDPDEPGASGWEALEHIGPITRTVGDAALMLSVMSGPTPRDRHSLPADGIDWMSHEPTHTVGLRVAFSADLGFATVDPEVAALTEMAARRLARSFDFDLVAANPATGDMQALFETLVALDTDRAGLRAAGASQGYAFRGQLGDLLARDWTPDEFTAAIMERKRVVNTLWRFMEDFDFLLTPATASAAFPINLDGPSHIGGRPVLPSAWAPFSALVNLTGQPAASVPAGLTSDGRPVGLQIVGRHLDDIGVLRMARACEIAMPWSYPDTCLWEEI
ncbi:amidase (plasmid) [Rhizobium sp. ACO-34A]|nr:amidase [Rhizobium sp. ACO-34A]